MKSKIALFLAQINNKIIDLLISPKTTLPWLVSATPAASWLIPLLAPVRESGSMLPQWWIQQSGVGEHPRRDYGWRLGIGIQLVGVLGFVCAGFLLPEVWLGWGILASLIVMSFGRAFTSVFSKDLQAELVERQSRGRFTGAISTVSGSLSIVFALLLIGGVLGENRLLINLGFTVVLASVIVAFGISFFITCEAKQSDGQRTPSILQQFSGNALLTHMVISRCLLLHAMLAIPFVTVQLGNDGSFSIGWLILASGLASLTASYFWGWFSDIRIIWTLVVASALSVLMLGMLWLSGETLPQLGKVAAFYLLLVGYDGVRVGRKTLLLNVTNEENRASFVGAGNTIVGLFLLLSGGIYSFIYAQFSDAVQWLLLFLVTLGLFHLSLLNNVVKKYRTNAQSN